MPAPRQQRRARNFVPRNPHFQCIRVGELLLGNAKIPVLVSVGRVRFRTSYTLTVRGRILDGGDLGGFERVLGLAGLTAGLTADFRPRLNCCFSKFLGRAAGLAGHGLGQRFWLTRSKNA